MKPIGYLHLIERHGLDVTPPAVKSYVLERGRRSGRRDGATREERYPPRDDPGDAWTGHLQFALKHEGVNLEVLAALFRVVTEREFTAWIASAPTGRYTRIAWFLFEWLTGRRLPLPDLDRGNYVPVLDVKRYFTVPPARATRARRHRVLDNLPGPPAYCPLVRRTRELDEAIALRLDRTARHKLSRYSDELVQRAARYLFFKETRSSYAIEHLQPDGRRAARFVELLRRAGDADCFDEIALVDLQRRIVDPRFAADAYRDFQNYIGESLGPGREVVHYVPPRPEDLRPLMDGWADSCRRMLGTGIHPVVVATVAGFGFVFLHPFEDGNGRLHRYLMHHVLAATEFTPPGVVFPVSALLLKHSARYDRMLESWSRPLMEHVDYRLSGDGALTVTNATAGFYRYPDMTWLAEQTFDLVRETVEIEFGRELEYLAAFDAARRGAREIVDMPDRRLDTLLQLCFQNDGKFPRRRRSAFRELTDAEIEKLEAIVRRAAARVSTGDVDDGV